MSQYTGINVLDKIKECIDIISDFSSNLDQNIRVSTTSITNPDTGNLMNVVTGIEVNNANFEDKLTELQNLYDDLHEEVGD